MFTINNTNLGRDITIVDDANEGRQAVAAGVPRENIYLAAEVETMHGIPMESLAVVQTVKDVFPGAIVTVHGSSSSAGPEAAAAGAAGVDNKRIGG